MKQIRFSFDHARTANEPAKEQKGRLQASIEHVSKAWDAGYDSDYASIALPQDSMQQECVLELARAKKELQPKLMIVIGIGGSNLGSMAVQQALHGILYNHDPGMGVYFVDSVDGYFTNSVYQIAKEKLKKKQPVLLVIISKSGTTTETIANGQLFIELLCSHQTNYQEYVVVITDAQSKLESIAQKNNFATLRIPKLVGGRYSVFSPVALFPLAMLDIAIDELLQGAASVQQLTAVFDNNPAAQSAAILYEQFKAGSIIHDSFIFCQRLEALGLWYRQLVGESLGKDEVGNTPTISIGSADLHSVAQLYLAGPDNRITSFISVAHENLSLTVPEHSPLDTLVPMINGKTYQQIMQAIISGTKIAYQKQARPYISIELPEITPYYIGQFMQLKMIETIYLGALFSINPFDQPHVEIYKKETRTILEKDI